MGAIIQSQHDLIKFWSKRWHEPLNTVATSEAWHKFFIKLIMHGGEHQNIQIYECNYQKWKKFEYVRVHAKWVCSKKYTCQVCFTSLCGTLPVCFNRILEWWIKMKINTSNLKRHVIFCTHFLYSLWFTAQLIEFSLLFCSIRITKREKQKALFLHTTKSMTSVSSVIFVTRLYVGFMEPSWLFKKNNNALRHACGLRLQLLPLLLTEKKRYVT